MATRPDNKTTLNPALELLKRTPRKRKVSTKELQGQLNDAGIKLHMLTTCGVRGKKACRYGTDYLASAGCQKFAGCVV